MDINMFIQIVNGVGFPIAACIAMGIFIVWDKKTKFKEKEEYTKLKDYYFEYRDNDNSKRTYEYIISKGY